MHGRPRIPKMRMTRLGVTFIAPRNPAVAMWWSVLLPGLGHMYVESQLTGFLLMLWEAILNHKANLNLAIFHTILGQYSEAGRVLRLEWALMYPFMYLFAIFDSYRLAVQVNRFCQLEEVQAEREFHWLALKPIFGLNFLDKRNPLTTGLANLILGGLGHLYNFRHAKAVILTTWFIVVVLMSRSNVAYALTMQGRFAEAAAVLDYQWVLFGPSIMVFNMVNGYTDAVDLNNLYDEAWEYRLRDYLLNPSWPQKKQRQP
ncbi:MAG TPA: hypothetical protein VNT75_25825 [Symbiobacteriaceae bacterium]|nr:hypothetical protein [Symbiobacteriaceae bacterium]